MLGHSGYNVSLAYRCGGSTGLAIGVWLTGFPFHPLQGTRNKMCRRAWGWEGSQLGCALDWGHIRYLGSGDYWFRSYSGSLLKSAKVSKTLLPQHSAPRLGSVCPHSGFGAWAAAMGHPWPSAANPASCRVTHGFKPALGQRGLTGRLRSRSKTKPEPEQATTHLIHLYADRHTLTGRL